MIRRKRDPDARIGPGSDAYGHVRPNGPFTTAHADSAVTQGYIFVPGATQGLHASNASSPNWKTTLLKQTTPLEADDKMHSALFWSALLALAASPPCHAESFDYIIVGAGTSGLVLANRLSQDPSVAVAVIDPGADQRGNPTVRNPAVWPQLLKTPVNWAYQSVPQANASGRVIEYDAGKGIGGTSLINGMTYIRGDKAQFDAWEELGNPGWNWDTLLHYYKRLEKFSPPEPWQIQVGASAKSEYHGERGQLHVGFTPMLQNGSFYDAARASWSTLGQGVNEDADSGTTRGFDVWPQTLDTQRNERWDAATAFFWPVSARQNPHLLNGTASRVVWAPGGDARGPQASGVEYVTPANERRTVNATREVIISAGALRTPLILERSGIGNPRLLRERGIEPVVDSPGVGENLIDQPNVSLLYASKVTHNGTSPYATFATARDLFGSRVGDVATSTRASLRQWAEQAAQSSNGGLNASALEHIFRIQHGLVFDKGVTIAEILTTAGADKLLSALWALLPFSRGSVHIRSADDIGGPVIDPKFLAVGFDRTVQVAAGRLAAEFWRTAPISDVVAGQYLPSSTVLPPDATDAQWESWTANTLGSNAHSVGTAAMMARELGGVVDPSLRV
ncbi:Glucose oxidase [Tolypocladium ophioglossoides CBS 100239]|uniref:Glucose oxidase n=1 Tax=Tolypocladium ophioglossoides (strain CBS 100239) TaxID=1163406 RepID=A0A0L0N056_TOLOC|nr:Glucose oxidase [Tolypocladium ophioglossoides CBS 100239]